tara:strand:- start:1083 stop:1541 length:459 start_codon:yes stop_codon:yes gene_type:complete
MIAKIYEKLGKNKGKPYRFPNYYAFYDYGKDGAREHHMLNSYWLTKHVHINKHVAGQARHNDNIHEHYCGFMSVILKGSYVQEIDKINGKGRVIEQVKWFNWMPRHYRHRIIHTNNKPCWSIMFKNPFKKFRTFIKAYASDNSSIELPINYK